jgi:hypothetical protein
MGHPASLPSLRRWRADTIIVDIAVAHDAPKFYSLRSNGFGGAICDACIECVLEVCFYERLFTSEAG